MGLKLGIFKVLAGATLAGVAALPSAPVKGKRKKPGCTSCATVNAFADAQKAVKQFRSS